MEKLRPALIPDLDDIIDICAGGMHTICLTSKGKVLTFGCNDEGVLGRDSSKKGTETVPGEVKLECVAMQISAGDSHSAALLEDGRVFAWGSFRDSHGAMGLSPNGVQKLPMLMPIDQQIVKIASGADHLVMLTAGGHIFTCGCAEQGQLGRVSERSANRESRQGVSQLLIPMQVYFKRSYKLKFDNIWAGSYCTFTREKNGGNIYVFGLNNYNQLGIDNSKTHFHPVLAK
uniref:RCC1-like domain-containing protein n=1 Tax=Clastoptera arizonana TaxID=38151 RepID=A0A1B6DMR9_9HEMI